MLNVVSFLQLTELDQDQQSRSPSEITFNFVSDEEDEEAEPNVATPNDRNENEKENFEGEQVANTPRRLTAAEKGKAPVRPTSNSSTINSTSSSTVNSTSSEPAPAPRPILPQPSRLSVTSGARLAPPDPTKRRGSATKSVSHKPILQRPSASFPFSDPESSDSDDDDSQGRNDASQANHESSLAHASGSLKRLGGGVLETAQGYKDENDPKRWKSGVIDEGEKGSIEGRARRSRTMGLANVSLSQRKSGNVRKYTKKEKLLDSRGFSMEEPVKREPETLEDVSLPPTSRFSCSGY